MKIIAEAGINHNGSSELALELVDAAKTSGADVVKFQTFKAKRLVTIKAEKAQYQKDNDSGTKTQYEMLRNLELSQKSFLRISEHCSKSRIDFLSTAFDSYSLSFLVNEIGLSSLKIASGELTNAPFLLDHAKVNKNLIVSTGLSTLGDIEAALGVLAFGFVVGSKEKPSVQGFREAFYSKEGQVQLRRRVTLLHCTTEYPVPYKEVNLAAMDTMRKSFGLPVGYSDHSRGIEVSIAAAALGAAVIEKHFTLDKNMEGPDHKASLDPVELKSMTRSIRNVVSSLGDGRKTPSASELKNIDVARKSLVAKKDIKKGQLLNSKNIESKRPGNGSSPFNYWKAIGQKATRSYSEGDFIVLSDLS